MPDEISKLIATELHDAVFSTVWNEPLLEHRSSIAPNKANTTISRGSVLVEDEREALPNNVDTFVVYQIPKIALRGMSLDAVTSWVTANELSIKHRISLQLVTRSGLVMSTTRVYVKTTKYSPLFMIALDNTAFRKAVGPSYSMLHMHLTFGYDSDIDGTVRTTGYRMADTASRPDYVNVMRDVSYMTIDGGVHINPDRETFYLGSYIDAIRDTNITGRFNVDYLTAKKYISTDDGTERVLIHVPKSLNPDNKIISHDTCDFLIIPRDGSAGRLLPRTRVGTVYQITHNDFGISMEELAPIITGLGTTAVDIVCILRSFSKTNVLTRDKNYIDLLYLHTDTQIIAFLSGTAIPAFSFWRAEHLEASKYVKSFFDVVDIPTPTDIAELVDIFGYYRSIEILCPRVKYFQQTSDIDRTFEVGVPKVMSLKPLRACVYVRGEKVPEEYVSSHQSPTKSLIVELDPLVPLNVGDSVAVEFFSDEDRVITRIVASDAFHNVPLSTSRFVIYEYVETDRDVVGIVGEHDKTYVPREVSAVGSVVDDQLVIDSIHFGKEYFVVFDTGFVSRRIELDDILNSFSPPVIDLSFNVTSELRTASFSLGSHVSPTTSNGTLLDPTDPSALSPTPAWRVLDGESGIGHRWEKSLSTGPARFTYTMAQVNRGKYYLVGYRLGTSTSADVLQDTHVTSLPIDYAMKVDGVTVHTVTNKLWTNNNKRTRLHMLDAPVLVNTSLEFEASRSQSTKISVDKWEPIFSESVSTALIPALGDITVIAFLNGKSLVEGIDYEIVRISNLAYPGSIMATQLVVYNVSYLKPADNYLEAFIVNNAVLGKSSGFKVTSQLQNDANSILWFNNMSIVSVDGRVTMNQASEFGGIITNEQRVGAPFGTRTIIPKDVSAALDEYHSNDDAAVVSQLIEYFRTQAVAPNLVLLTHSHRIASLYLTLIIKDLLSGDLVLSDLPSTADFMAQLTTYSHLKQYDLFFREGNSIDIRYVDIQPAYVSVNASIDVLRIVRRLIALVKDEIYHGRPSNER